jgi:hypothetical protein
MIRDPISLSEIEASCGSPRGLTSANDVQSRLSGRRYDTWEEFFGQVEQMCLNAMTYNEDESDVFRDAQQIRVS